MNNAFLRQDKTTAMSCMIGIGADIIRNIILINAWSEKNIASYNAIKKDAADKSYNKIWTSQYLIHSVQCGLNVMFQFSKYQIILRYEQ